MEPTTKGLKTQTDVQDRIRELRTELASVNSFEAGADRIASNIKAMRIKLLERHISDLESLLSHVGN